jgi:hypothetical protein
MQIWGRLLSTVEDHVVDQADVAEAYGSGDQRFSIPNLFSGFQGICVHHGDVIDFRERFGTDGFFDDLGDLRGISFAGLERALAFAKPLEDDSGLLPLFIAQQRVARRQGQAGLLANGRQYDDLGLES